MEVPSIRIAEVVRRTGYSADTIRRAADRGEIRCVRSPGGERRFYESDVARFERLAEAMSQLAGEAAEEAS